MKRIAIIAIAAIGLLFGGCTASEPQSSTSASPSPSVAASPSPSAEDILNKVGAETKFQPKFDQWGQGKALLIVDTGWQSLTESEKNTVIEYVKTNGGTAILVGKLTGAPNTITLDRTVWGE